MEVEQSGRQISTFYCKTEEKKILFVLKAVIAMFMGEYNHTIDTKGRLIIPSKFREALGDGFVVTKGLDGCQLVCKAKQFFLHCKQIFSKTVSIHTLLNF